MGRNILRRLDIRSKDPGTGNSKGAGARAGGPHRRRHVRAGVLHLWGELPPRTRAVQPEPLDAAQQPGGGGGSALAGKGTVAEEQEAKVGAGV
jgi:hypothetical protein